MLYIASDHAGYHLKKRLLRFFENEQKTEVADLGPAEYKEDDDYPDYAIPLAKKVAADPKALGILICQNGVGVCMVANKVAGVRAGLGYNIMAAETMKTDDNTNVLCLAAKLGSEDHAIAVVKHWLAASFSNEERHKRRLKKVESLLS